MQFYDVGSRDAPVIRAMAKVWDGGHTIKHSDIRDAILEFVPTCPRRKAMYGRLGRFIAFQDGDVLLTAKMVNIIEAFQTTDDHFFVRIGEDTEFLGYSNFNVRRRVERGTVDGFMLQNGSFREHYIAIPKGEANRLMVKYDAPLVKDEKITTRQLIERGNPIEVLSLLENAGHGETILADKVRIHIRDSVLPNHIMYDVKKIL